VVKKVKQLGQSVNVDSLFQIKTQSKKYEYIKNKTMS